MQNPSARVSSVVSGLVARTAMDRRLARIVTPTIEGMGFELIRLRLGGGTPPRLQIMAERPEGGIEVDECAAISTALSAVLDIEDPIADNYTLEISSPGIDRPLTRSKDFDTWKGHLVRVDLNTPIGGRKRFKGVLQGTGAGGVVIAVDGAGGASAAGGAPETIEVCLEWLADARLVLTENLIRASLDAHKHGARKHPDTARAATTAGVAPHQKRPQGAARPALGDEKET